MQIALFTSLLLSLLDVDEATAIASLRMSGFRVELDQSAPPKVIVDCWPFSLTRGALPNFSKIKHLHALHVSGNEIGNEAFQTLEGLERLTILQADDTSITDQGCAYLVKSPIRELSLQNCKITDKGLASLTKIRSLRHLKLTCSSMSSECISTVSQFTELESLHLYALSANEKGFESMKRMNSLRHLLITGDAIDDESLRAIVRSCPNLERLTLRQGKITDLCFESIVELTNLKVLDLRSNGRLSGTKGIDRLSKMARLTELNLGFTAINARSGELICKLRQIQVLNLEGNEIDDSIVPRLGSMQQLRLLSIGFTKISDDGLEELSNSLPDAVVFKNR